MNGTGNTQVFYFHSLPLAGYQFDAIQGHQAGTIEDLTLSRMLPQTREWIERQVERNTSTEAMWDLLRAEGDDIEFLMDVMSGKADSVQVEVSESHRVTRQHIYNAVRRKLYCDTRKGANLDESLHAWQEELEKEGWLVLYSAVIAEAGGFVFAFSAPWQVKVSSIIC